MLLTLWISGYGNGLGTVFGAEITMVGSSGYGAKMAEFVYDDVAHKKHKVSSNFCIVFSFQVHKSVLT